MSLSSSLRKAIGEEKKCGPVWKGPEEDGISFSLLSRFLVCRERFRLLMVEGLKPRDAFNPRIEFGNMWHVCEESHSGGPDCDWKHALTYYCRQLTSRYRLSQDQIAHWFEVAKAMFPLYVQHWSKHPGVVNRTPLFSEQVFNVPYKLPSGRVVRLKGKWDSVDLASPESGAYPDGRKPEKGIWLQENKTKSSIDADKIQRQLYFDLQTMMYIVALTSDTNPEFPPPIKTAGYPILGVRYNVVRRSAHKSVASMLKKVEEDRKDGRIGEWFSRWNVRILPSDILKFKTECLNPILEQLCDWWEVIGYLDYQPTWNRVGELSSGSRLLGQDSKSLDDAIHRLASSMVARHWRHPFGVYNVLDEGGSSELDSYLAGEGEVGLERTDNLFPELT